MMQVGRNLTDRFDRFLLAKRFLIMDRDKKFTEGFRRLLDDAGTRAVRLPPRSPNLNAYVERFILSIKSECSDRFIFFGENSSFWRAVNEFVCHYHEERNLHALGNRLIEPENGVGKTTGETCCRERLGGLLRYYYRQAA